MSRSEVDPVTLLDKFGCRGNTIKVAAGHYVDLVNPDPESIDIYSIAAALSKICRYGGHCPRFYSVAEHSVLAMICVNISGTFCKHHRSLLSAVLLHDATEAYLGDMVKPLKVTMSQYRAAEKRFEEAIEEKFDVRFSDWHNTIKSADRAMLKAEKMQMWPDDKEQWEGFGDIKAADVTIECLSPAEAEEKFLYHAYWLGLI